MELTWDKLDQKTEPTADMLAAYVGNPLWQELCGYIEAEYKARPLIEYSGCGMQPGWNMKYKKSGRGLCTLYPMEGYYTTLVVIGKREKAQAELLLPALTEYTQNLYANTKEGMGQRWLMLDVQSSDVLNDVKELIAVRRNS